MHLDTVEDWKTAWDKTAEQEWIDEQWAAEEDRPFRQSTGLQLQREVAAALRDMSPRGIWQQLTDLVLTAIEEEREEAERLGWELGIGGYWTEPKDLSELYIRATALDPIFAVNEFSHVNPDLSLDGPRLAQKLTPLQALCAVVRMWTHNNHRQEAL